MVTFCIRRRALALAAAALAAGLGACAGVEDGPPGVPPRRAAELLTPWLTLDGGWLLQPQPLIQAAPRTGPRQRFIQPVGVAALGDVLLVADAGARALWRVDRGRDAMARLAPFAGPGSEAGTSLQLGTDMSVWVALPAAHEVVQYDARGQLVRRWRDEANAIRPVAVAVPEDRSEILVGDGATASVLVFDPLGRTKRQLWDQRPAVLQSIAAMCMGPLGLYVLDPLAQQVVVFDTRGEVVQIVGEHHLVRPRALAVDRSGRVFVSDDADQSIKVFRESQLIARAGGIGNAPGRFGRIESMAVDGNLLYVADSVNARVQVMLVAPPSMEAPGDGARQ